MKTIKNIFRTTLIFLFLAGLLSCGNVFSNRKSETNRSGNNESKTTLKINVQDTSVARAIFPSNDASYLTNFVIKGKKTGSEESPAQLGTAEDYTALSNLVIYFEQGDEGSWDLTLEAGYKIGSGTSEQTLTFSDTKTVNIQKNVMNTVSFALKSSDYNYGGINITINLDDTTNTVDAAYVELQTPFGMPIDGIPITSFESISGGKRFTYSRPISDEETRLEAGLYTLVFQIYSYSDFLGTPDDPIHTYPVCINIVNGLTTTATLNIAVNQIYDVSYEYISNGKQLTVEDGQTFPTGVTINGAGVLPVKYYSAGTPLPALKLDNYVFAGWYDAPIGGNRLSTAAGFPASGTSKTFYARFIEPELVVSSNGFDGYTSIDAAIYYIASLGDSSSNWTIKVNTSVTGPQTIDGFFLDGRANSITIQGLFPPSPGATPTDTIDAGLTTATENGAALAINTTVPVILKDIKITGGNNDNNGNIKGGGLFIGIGADVTLDDGVLINGNTADLGSGVFARSSFKMKGSAQVDSNNDLYLGMGEDLNFPAYLRIAGSLTNSTPATITPYEYKNQRQLIYVLDEAGLSTEEKPAEFLKFAIKQPEGLNYTWNVNTKGRLTKYTYSTDAHDYVDFHLPSGTLWSAMNWGETDSLPGKQYSYWYNFTYGDSGYSSEPVWGEEWDIASTEEWQELIDNCYWKGPYNLRTDGGNNYSAYYVFEAKTNSDKGKVVQRSETDNYDPDKDVCIKITQTAYNKAVVYWPQIFVDTAYNKSQYNDASSYTPKPTKIDLSGSKPILTNTWSTANENYQYYRLVISKKRTLCVSPTGNSNNTGKNARDALPSIQDAVAKISTTSDSDIDWSIAVFGNLTVEQTLSGISTSNAKSLTIYGGKGLDGEGVPQDSIPSLYRPENLGVQVTIKDLTITDGTDTNFMGALLLSDNSLVLYDSTPLNFTATQVSKAAGVVFELDENNAPAKVLGIKNTESDSEYGLMWASNSSPGLDKNFANTVCTPTDQTDIANTGFEGNMDGSLNWGYICDEDNTASSNVETDYPAFYYALTYGTATGAAPNLTGTSYEDGWYIPSLAELCYVNRNKTTIKNTFNAINTAVANTTVFLDEAELWTSSQKSDTTANAWIVSFSNNSQFNGITSMTKKTMKHIFCIHKIK